MLRILRVQKLQEKLNRYLFKFMHYTSDTLAFSLILDVSNVCYKNNWIILTIPQILSFRLMTLTRSSAIVQLDPKKWTNIILVEI